MKGPTPPTPVIAGAPASRSDRPRGEEPADAFSTVLGQLAEQGGGAEQGEPATQAAAPDASQEPTDGAAAQAAGGSDEAGDAAPPATSPSTADEAAPAPAAAPSPQPTVDADVTAAIVAAQPADEADEPAPALATAPSTTRPGGAPTQSPGTPPAETPPARAPAEPGADADGQPATSPTVIVVADASVEASGDDEAGTPPHGERRTPASPPEHARAGEVPGRAKAPGEPAGRPFAEEPASLPGRVPAKPEAAVDDGAPAPAEPPPASLRGQQQPQSATAVTAGDPEPAGGSTASPSAPQPAAPQSAGLDPLAPLRQHEHAAAAARRTVRLAELAEHADALIRLAARNGMSTARITLSPPELGQVEIQLRYRAAGIVAELTAESAQAVQALGQASADLRRSLEAQGLVVIGLDIRQSDPETRSDTGDRGSGEPAPERHGAESTDELQETNATSAVAARLDSGAVVDVLA